MSQHSSKGTEWEKKRAIVIRNYEGMCAKCQAEGATHVDHVVPKSLGGSDELSNLQLLCQKCNTTKGARVEGSRTTWHHPYWYPSHASSVASS